ncbi:anthranilate phosphoribosyltransferase [Thalassoglobus sp. JC818]|uniref:anthranilate phosphoribosyltransferase n=1 Tax=Thalassoglobus sp. JC818 TaxID=3232136 RepID=UPI00345A7328
MHVSIRAVIEKILQNEEIQEEPMQAAVGAIMDGECSPVDVSSFLTALAVDGETETEIAGAAAAMRKRSLKIETSQTGLIDTCGTGGDKLHTFNISTATALIVAACGQPVAKHGNRSVSSSSGSADVLEALGVNIGLSAELAGQCLDELGICFCYARLFHGAMKHVAPIRAELGIRTIFNLLGPLTNPASAEFQLLGANRDGNAERIAQAASRLGTKKTFVVCGNDQLDEVSLWGKTRVWEVTGNNPPVLMVWTPADFGLEECHPDELKVSSPGESADVIRSIISGQAGPARRMVVANAAAALLCSGRASSLIEGVRFAEDAIDRGEVRLLLNRLAEWSQSHQDSVTNG